MGLIFGRCFYVLSLRCVRLYNTETCEWCPIPIKVGCTNVWSGFEHCFVALVCYLYTNWHIWVVVHKKCPEGIDQLMIAAHFLHEWKRKQISSRRSDKWLDTVKLLLSLHGEVGTSSNTPERKAVQVKQDCPLAGSPWLDTPHPPYSLQPANA